MVKCAVCGQEIRYIVGAPSTGFSGQPIAVDIAVETLISENGRRLQGYREHKCKPRAVGLEENHDFNPGAGYKLP